LSLRVSGRTQPRQIAAIQQAQQLIEDHLGAEVRTDDPQAKLRGRGPPGTAVFVTPIRANERWEPRKAGVIDNAVAKLIHLDALSAMADHRCASFTPPAGSE
jgi:hypothetical protein